MAIQIKELHTYPQFEQLRELHQEIWGMPAGAGLYPPMVNTAAANGGIVLGAFDGPRMIGFLFSFLGRHPDGTLKICSQTVGFLPEYRGRGLGTRIKWVQRRLAIRAGTRLITWTYDPLEAPNAYVNLHKLGGFSQTYKENIYGDDFLRFGSGLASDRFIVEWWLESERVKQLASSRPPSARLPEARATATQAGRAGPRLAALNLDLDSTRIALEIPASIQELKAQDLSEARRWRTQTRRAFSHYFELGYAAVDVHLEEQKSGMRVFYILEKR